MRRGTRQHYSFPVSMAIAMCKTCKTDESVTRDMEKNVVVTVHTPGGSDTALLYAAGERVGTTGIRAGGSSKRTCRTPFGTSAGSPTAVRRFNTRGRSVSTRNAGRTKAAKRIGEMRRTNAICTKTLGESICAAHLVAGLTAIGCVAL